MLEQAVLIKSHRKTHTIAIAALLLIIVALFWRVFFLGETLVDLATHQNQLPWGATESRYDGYSRERSDLTNTYITRDYFVVESYRNKELPLWNPFILSGHPIYADGVTKLFNPTNLIYFFFDIPQGYSFVRLTELALAVIFLYIFLVNLGVGSGGAFVGSLVFLLSDHTMQHLTWLGWMGGAMWLPLMLLGADRAIHKDRVLPAVAAGGALALQFYCGFMPASIYYLGALIIYYLAVPWLTGRRGISAYKPVIKSLAISLIVGMGLSAPIWLPVFELLGYSNRKIVPTELSYIWLPPWQLLTLLLPRAFGQAFEPKYLQMFVEMGVSHDRSLYLGVLALPLIGLALWRPGDRRIYYFAGLVAGAILVVTCAPIYVHFTKYIPVLKTIRAIQRISILYAFGGSVLAAFGAGRLLAADRTLLLNFVTRVRYITVRWLILLTAATLLFGALYKYLPQDVDKGGTLRRWGLKLAVSLADQFHWSSSNNDLLVPVAILLGLILLCWSFSRNHWSPVVLLSVMAVLLAGELIWNDSQYNKTYSAGLIYRPTATTDFLKENLGLYRLVVAPAEFKGKAGAVKGDKIVAPPNTLLPYRLATIAGKDQLFPKWYRELTALVEPQNELSHIIFNRQQSPVYDLLGVKYLVTKERNPAPSAAYHEVYNGEGIRIYQNQDVMPRVFFAPQIREVKRPEEALAMMKEDSFDPHATVIVETKGSDVGFAAPPEASDRVEIKEYKNNEVNLQASSTGTRLLVLTDTYYPGWEVFVDGNRAELLRVNYAMRGVILNSGEHRVQFVFRPRSFRNGLAISLATLLACAVLLAFNREREPQRHKESL
jgi:hypothetical protein